MRAHGNCAKDACLYTDEAIRVGLILFTPRTCGACHAVLPANTDYFAPSKQVSTGFVFDCRRCRRAASRGRYVARKARAET